MWECVGGSVVKGEDSLQGAIREAKEEVGVDLLPENGQVLLQRHVKSLREKSLMILWMFGCLNMMERLIWVMQQQMKWRRLLG